MKWLDKKELRHTLVQIGVVFGAIMLYYYVVKKQVLLSDSLFLAGLLYFTIGLWREVRRLGFFNMAIYSTKRLFRRTNETFADYVDSHPYEERFVEPLLTGLVVMVISQLILLFVYFPEK